MRKKKMMRKERKRNIHIYEEKREKNKSCVKIK
jgi:hypothetical protein